MRTIKFKKKWYGDLNSLYVDNDLVYDNKCNPSRVYINPVDEKLIRATYKKLLTKEHKLASKHWVNGYVSLKMLNLCPNISKGVAEGYILVEESVDE